MQQRLLTATFTLSAFALLGPSSADAALFGSDGFEAGGATPGAGQYTTGTGYGAPGDALVAAGNNSSFQGPTTTGFDAGTPWQGGGFLGGGGFSGAVYYQAAETGLSYSDGTNQLDTSTGGVRHLHEDTPSSKTVTRSLVNKPTPGSVSYFSFIMRYESEDNNWSSESGVGLQQGDGQLSARHTKIGINTSGQLELFASHVNTTVTGPSLAQDQDHFVLVRFEELSGTPDSIHVWLNPALDAEPTLGSADVDLTANFIYVAGNASFKFDTIGIESTLNNSGAANPEDFVYYDEFRLGETYADVTPHTVIPEPGSLALLGLGGLVLARRRRR